LAQKCDRQLSAFCKGVTFRQSEALRLTKELSDDRVGPGGYDRMMPQVTFRGLSSSHEIKQAIYRKSRKLSAVVPALRGCHVVIEASPRGHPRPSNYRVTVHLSGGTGADHRLPRHSTSESLQAALGDAFRSAHRQLTTRH
jgi:ribosome-associated translation inhibitor RaiA